MYHLSPFKIFGMYEKNSKGCPFLGCSLFLNTVICICNYLMLHKLSMESSENVLFLGNKVCFYVHCPRYMQTRKKITSINFNNIISASTQILVYWEFAIQNCNMSQHSRFWPSKIKNIQYNFTNFIVILYFLNDTSDHK